MKKSPWISFAGVFLGLWLLISPATFNYQSRVLTYSDLACGVVLLIASLGCRRLKTVLVAWVFAIVGMWLECAPLIFWAPDPACYLNNTIVGMLTLALFILMPTIPNQIEETGPSVPPGWSYNPSSWPQRLPIALLAFIGWLFSLYLAAFQLGYLDVVWDPFFPNGTLRVLTSNVSKAFPIPDAGLGAFAYSLEILSTFQGSERRWRTMPWMVIIFGLLAVPLSLTSVILIILQPIAVGAWCTLCLMTACCMLIVTPLSIDEVVVAVQYLRASKEKPFLKLLFQGGKCPGATQDHRSPALDEPLFTLLQATRWGVTVPWNLALTVFLGIFLMCFPGVFDMQGFMADLDHIIGALIVTVTMVALAEAVRSVRYLNIVLGSILVIFAFFHFAKGNVSLILTQIFLGILVTLLSIRKGPIREKFTFIS